MLDTLERTSVDSELQTLQHDAASACGRIPPLWDLANYVAVNPFLGFASTPITDAAAIVEAGLDADVLPPLEYYTRKREQGAISDLELRRAASRVGVNFAELASAMSAEPSGEAVLTFAERYDRVHGTEWQDQVVRSVARWCAVYASGDVAGQGLFASWREAAVVDRSLEIIGLAGWRRWALEIPADPAEALSRAWNECDLPVARRADYFYRLLGKVYGWASYFRRFTWEQGSKAPGDVGELLAIMACTDAKFAALVSPGSGAAPARRNADPRVRLALQEALEDRYAAALIGSLNAPRDVTTARPEVQAIFCIDVRSEPLRRHLESESPTIETRGFAGFFGVSLDWEPGDGLHSARCPVLLKPSVSLRANGSAPSSAIAGTARQLQSAPAAAFSFVELLGLSYGLKLASETLGQSGASDDADGSLEFSSHGIALERRVELAAGILKNMGFRTSFASLVMLCGHVSHSANNPHAAGLHCGACGGHGGAINARVAASLLNDAAVRRGLAELGVDLPADTHFLPAVHDTSVDRVTLLDVAQVPASHTAHVAALRGWLERAGEKVRQERTGGLGLAAAAPGLLERLLGRRSNDWSEVRPEWGLARNASFIAARRARSYGVDLQGRSFLHEYDAAYDHDGSILTLILSAPMIVASWINLQYFASTVDNAVFGCGNKVLHNRVGSLGVVLGNGGDLRTGLAMQSVHAPDGSWYHEPLRLQVIVEAEPARIDAVLAAQPSVRDLVENGWVRLFALDPQSTAAFYRVPGQGWEPVTGEEAA